jgi:hypothetical protein
MNKKLTALVLSGTLLCSMSAQAFALTLPAGETPKADNAITVKQNAQKIQTVLYSGTVKELVQDNGKLAQVVLQGEGGETAAVITDQTLWIDGEKSSTAAPADLAEGEKIFLVHSPISTRSLPPQTEAFAMVRHAAVDAKDMGTTGAFNSVVYTGTLKEMAKDGSGKLVQLILENQQGEYTMNLSDQTLWIDGETSGTQLPGSLKTGEKLCVVHSPISTHSLPPQSPAFAVVRAFDNAQGNPEAQTAPEGPNGGAEVPALPNSVLYFGTIKDITKDEKGTVSQLWLDSEAYGEYVMNLSYDTAWIDSGKGTASDPADLKVGESVYIHHSPIATMSLPPQSYGYAVVRNTPMDVSCAMYHVIEDLKTNDDGSVTVTTDNGGLYLTLAKDAAVSSYTGSKTTLADLKAGDKIMAWYGMVAESYPAQASTKQVMRLDTPGSVLVTRGSFAAMLHERAGGKQIKLALNYTDVNDKTPDLEAIRWATGAGLLSGYQDGSFRPDEQLTREQLVTVLWRHLGSVQVKDTSALDQYKDAGSIAGYARPAMAWAQEAGVLTGDKKGNVNPKGNVTHFEAENMLRSVIELNDQGAAAQKE